MPAPLLVVVDMQDVFRDPESPWAAPSFDATMTGVDRLVEAFGEHVAFTRFVPPDDRPGSWGPYYETFAGVLRPDRADWWELSEPYRDRAAAGRVAPVVRSTFAAWDQRLRDGAGEAATIVVCGVTTDCCVISTALAAADDGAFVRIASDACGGSSAAAHEAALTVMRGYAPQIEISSVEEELRRLETAGSASS